LKTRGCFAADQLWLIVMKRIREEEERLFNPQKFDKLEFKQQPQHIQTLVTLFDLNIDAALTEWTCYCNYLERHRGDTGLQSKYSRICSCHQLVILIHNFPNWLALFWRAQ